MIKQGRKERERGREKEIEERAGCWGGANSFLAVGGRKTVKEFPTLDCCGDRQAEKPPQKKKKKKKKQQQPKSKRSRGPEGCGWFVVVQLNELKVGLDRVCV